MGLISEAGSILVFFSLMLFTFFVTVFRAIGLKEQYKETIGSLDEGENIRKSHLNNTKGKIFHSIIFYIELIWFLSLIILSISVYVIRGFNLQNQSFNVQFAMLFGLLGFHVVFEIVSGDIIEWIPYVKSELEDLSPA